MKIDHLAIWVHDLERVKQFYETYFDGVAGEKYVNINKKFSSYFITFASGCRLEIMHRPDISHPESRDESEYMGLTHFALSTGSKARVDSLTETLRSAGYKIIGEPRTTGDGYYESVVLDPESNRIEITN